MDSSSHKRGINDLKGYILKHEPQIYSQNVKTAGAAILAIVGMAFFFIDPPQNQIVFIFSMIAGLYAVYSGYKQYSLSTNFQFIYKPMSELKEYKVETSKGLKAQGSVVYFADLLPARTEEAIGFKKAERSQICAESAFVSDELDDKICRARAIRQTIERNSPSFLSKDKELRHSQLLYLVTRVYNPTKLTVNERKVCFNSGLDGLIKACQGAATLSVSEVGYFDGLVSNEAFRSLIYEVPKNGKLKDGILNADLTTMFPAVFDPSSSQHRLEAQPINIASRHIGISTIAFTSDMQLVFFRQGEDQEIGGGKLSASGSGSSDFSDIFESSGEQCLKTTVEYGMARELCEEGGLLSGLSDLQIKEHIKKVAASTMVTGFFRWVDRCGKPEFVGVTKLDIAASEIPGDNIEVYKPTVVVEKWGRVEITKLDQVSQFFGFVADIEDSVTLSFYMALLRLAKIAEYEDSESETERKIFEEVNGLIFG
jgi:hypothetical protein